MSLSVRRVFVKINEMDVSHKALFIVALSGFAGGLMGYAHILNSSVDCSVYTSNSAVPAKYGASYDVFSAAKNLVVKAECDATSATITAGSTGSGKLVYKYGYEWRNDAWQRYTFTGTEESSMWIRGLATARRSRTVAEMASVNYVVAYTCQMVDGVWKCGCRDTQCSSPAWQLQAFKKINESLPTEDGIWGDYNELMLARLSDITATPGTPVTIVGAGFSTASNTVMVGDRALRVAATSRHGITFTVPNDMPTGVADIKVINEKGTATGSALMVTTPGATPPTLTSITPSSGPHGTWVTIRGTNFTPTGNILLTGFGTIRNLSSSDGTTITTTLSPFTNNPEMRPGGAAEAFGKSYEFRIYVVNKNGLSANPLIFNATF